MIYPIFGMLLNLAICLQLVSSRLLHIKTDMLDTLIPLMNRHFLVDTINRLQKLAEWNSTAVIILMMIQMAGMTMSCLL